MQRGLRAASEAMNAHGAHASARPLAADGASSGSRQSRMILNTVTVIAHRPHPQPTPPNAPLSLPQPVRETLSDSAKAAGWTKDRMSQACRYRHHRPFNEDGERRFTAPRGMVSKGWTRRPAAVSRRTAHQFEKLHRITSIGLSQNFRRIKLNANNCDLSTAVSQERIARSNTANGCGADIAVLLRCSATDLRETNRGRRCFYDSLALDGLVARVLPREN